MFLPDYYLYDTKLSVLTLLTPEELADAELVAQILAGPTPMEAMGSWILTLIGDGLARFGRGLARLAEASTYASSAGMGR